MLKEILILLPWNAPEIRISVDCLGKLSLWLKNILSCIALKCSRMKELYWLLGKTFTMVEENFDFSCSEMLQNEWFLWIVREYFHHCWWKFWFLLLWNAPEWRISIDWLGIFLPWLKKILSCIAPECSQMKDFYCLLGNTFHHGWRKFWLSLLWDAPEWRISIDWLGILSPWLKKIWKISIDCYGILFTMVEENFDFYCSAMLQNEGALLIVRENFHHGWRKLWFFLLWNAPEWRISLHC